MLPRLRSKIGSGKDRLPSSAVALSYSRRRTPILAVTAHAMAGDADACFAAGMDDYMTKPISPEKLEHSISTWVHSGARSASAS